VAPAFGVVADMAPDRCQATFKSCGSRSL
jgi:hypothetical protein